MSARHERALARARTNIDLVLGQIATGTADRPRKVSKYELALNHAGDWAADQPPKGEERGGSTTKGKADDRKEAASVKRRAAEAATRLLHSATEIERLSDLMARDVTYLTNLTPETPDEKKQALPGCKSCARCDVFNPVEDKDRGLCKWCVRYTRIGEVMPRLDLLKVLHNGTRRDLSAWLAKHMPDRSRAEPDEAPPCGTTFFTNTALSKEGTHDFHCHRAQGHNGPHASVDQDGNRVTPATESRMAS